MYYLGNEVATEDFVLILIALDLNATLDGDYITYHQSEVIGVGCDAMRVGGIGLLLLLHILL